MATLKILELTEENTCRLCDNAIGKYSCPRCNLLYCSLTCYQSPKHLECSESFYKECVMSNFDKNDKESQAKMKEIFQRFHEKNKITDQNQEDDDDDDDGDEDDDESGEYETEETDSDDGVNDMLKSLSERLLGIDLEDSEAVWENLNDDERQEFEAFISSGDVNKFITMWSPWWEFRCEKRMIEVSELDEQKSKCPKIAEIRNFSDLSSKSPATCVQHNLMNVIAAYAFSLRYLNGDQSDFPKEACTYIYNLSLNLSQNQNFDSFNQAVHSVTANCTNNVLGIMADKDNLEFVKSDVHKILSGPHATEKKYYLYCALSDMLGLFTDAQKQQSDSEKKKEGGFYQKFGDNQFSAENLISVEEMKKCTKRIEYFLAYAKDCYDM